MKCLAQCLDIVGIPCVSHYYCYMLPMLFIVIFLAIVNALICICINDIEKCVSQAFHAFAQQVIVYKAISCLILTTTLWNPKSWRYFFFSHVWERGSGLVWIGFGRPKSQTRVKTLQVSAFCYVGERILELLIPYYCQPNDQGKKTDVSLALIICFLENISKKPCFMKRVRMFIFFHVRKFFGSCAAMW